MSYPPRLGHLATRPVLVAKLTPTFSKSHEIDDEEARVRLERAIAGRLWEQLLVATWAALIEGKKTVNDEAVLERVAGSLKDRPQRPGREATLSPAFSAFLVLLDLEAGTAGDSARRVLERPEGQRMAELGLTEAGRFLAKELTR